MSEPATSPLLALGPVDLRAVTVTDCVTNAKARKPAYVLTLDAGPLGVLTSSAQITELYAPQALIGRQVIAAVNLPPKRVAGVKSEALVLGIHTPKGVTLLSPDRDVLNGDPVA